MAGNKNSGGFRPSAPQNSPTNVNALGGNGQSGQANPNYTGFAYGENKNLSEQASGAKMQGMPTPPAASQGQGMPSGISSMPSLQDVEPSGLPITDGVNFGPGRGSEALPNNLNPDRRQIENADLIARYLPDLINATRVSNAPDSYKRFVNKLKGMI